MTLLRRPTAAPTSAPAPAPGALRLAAAGRSGDDAGAFLDLLGRLLRLPPAESTAIREELDGHLRERVRDLMIAGRSEPEAVRGAIEELGDAAALASRFRAAARTPFRRKAMNFAILGVAGAALVTSLVAVNDGGGGRQRSAVYQPSSRAAESGAGGPVSLDVVDTPLSEVIASLARALDAQGVVRWPALEEIGADREHPISLRLVRASAAQAFEAINEEVFDSESEHPIQYRLHEGVLEVASAEYFDRRETTLVRYDIGSVLEAGVSEEDFTSLVREFVEPPSWVDNGGDKASMRILAGKAFVKAPPRIHDGVVWFIEQLGEEEKVGAVPVVPGGRDLPLIMFPRTIPDDGVGLNDPGFNIFSLQHATPSEVIAALQRDHPELGLEYTEDSGRNALIARGPAKGRGALTEILLHLDRAAVPTP